MESINGAIGRGTTVVIAAGHGNVDASGFLPTGCSHVIAVGAIDNAAKRSVWSTTKKSDHGAAVDVALPPAALRTDRVLSHWASASAGPLAVGRAFKSSVVEACSYAATVACACRTSRA